MAVLRVICLRPSFPCPVPGAGTRGAGCGWLGLPHSVAATDAPAFLRAAGFPRAGTPGRPGWLGGGQGKLQGVSRPSPRSPRTHFCPTVPQASQRDGPPSQWAAGVGSGPVRPVATWRRTASQTLRSWVRHNLTHRGKAPLPRACGHAEWGAEPSLLLPRKGREGAQRLGARPQARPQTR